MVENRYEGDPDWVAVVVPGGNYTPARPLLHYANQVLVRRGWTVQEMWWELPEHMHVTTSAPWPNAAERIEWVAKQVAAVLDAEQASRLLLLGKSLGSLAAGVAADRGVPAVWLTPILAEPALVPLFAAAAAQTLLVGGTADRVWNGELARSLGAEVLEVPDADHGLELPGDPFGSIDVLKQVTQSVDKFVAGLANSWTWH